MAACGAANAAGKELEADDRGLLAERLLRAVPYRVHLRKLSPQETEQLVGIPVPFLFGRDPGQGVWQVRLELGEGPHGARVRLQAPRFYRNVRPIPLGWSVPDRKALSAVLKPPRPPRLPTLPPPYEARVPADEVWVGGRSRATDVVSAVTLGLVRPGRRRRETAKEKRRRLARFRKDEQRRRQRAEDRRARVAARRAVIQAEYDELQGAWEAKIKALEAAFWSRCEGDVHRDGFQSLELGPGSSCEWLTWGRPWPTSEPSAWGMGLIFKQAIHLREGGQRCAWPFVWRVPLGPAKGDPAAAVAKLLPGPPKALSELPGRAEVFIGDALTR